VDAAKESNLLRRGFARHCRFEVRHSETDRSCLLVIRSARSGCLELDLLNSGRGWGHIHGAVPAERALWVSRAMPVDARRAWKAGSPRASPFVRCPNWGREFAGPDVIAFDDGEGATTG
jgi:hypothetical protein